ncbi:MAG TPA: sugar transferase [Polyangiaceae bacterium]|nr:sugar transferase [Polyangiaceae bacterium]
MPLARKTELKIKRCIDVVGAATGLVVLSPVLAGVALAIRVTLGAPVLFRQQRPGLGGRPFQMIKFRTMAQAKPGETWYRTDEQRLTRLGRFLRRTSLDELPELFLVLKGDMSLVGPRPLLMEYLAKYTPEEMRRHEMVPGITGYAQVNGRQNTPFSQRLRDDVWYVDHFSLKLDGEILFKTIGLVFQREGVIPGQNVDDVDDLGLTADRARVSA